MDSDNPAQDARQQGRLERRRRGIIIGLGVAALAIYVGLGLVSLKHTYDREIEFARRSQDNLAKALVDHARSSIEKIDNVLLTSQLRLDTSLTGEKHDTATINATLARYLALIRESQSLRIADREGRFIYDASGEISDATIADRNYFQRNKAQSDGKLVISEPLFARITQNWVITLSRRLNDSNGEFAGLVQAAVRTDHFQKFYASLNLGPAQSITLIDSQLRLVARYPETPEMIGKTAASAAMRSLVTREQSEGMYIAHSSADGIERLYAARKIGDYPLYIVVGQATASYLDNWYRQVFWIGLSAGILALVLVGWMSVWLRTYNQARRLALGMTQAYETTVRRTSALLDSLPDPAWLTDREQRLIAVNEAFSRLCERPTEDMLGQPVTAVCPPSMAAILEQLDRMALDSLCQQRQESEHQLTGGRLRHFECISTPVLDEQHNLAGLAGVARDITQIHEDQARIRHLAEHDMLTDLPNRALLGNRMSVALADALGEQVQIALIFLDLDQFKNINDTLGHDVGDQLLLQVARRIRENLDERDTISRQGGDEFAVLIQDFGNLARLAFIAQRLIDAINRPFLIGGHELRVGASTGISVYPQDGSDIGTLLKNADTAMYQAKGAGGNAFRFFTPEMNARISERVALENNLRRAIQNHEFRLHYQPQVDGRSGQLIGMEALIRWQHPEKGEIPPIRFIPVAEESNLINLIGEWVLREACRQNAEWIKCGHPPIVVAVNISAMQLRQPNLPEQVAGILGETGLDPCWLELEITESAFIGDTERIIETLALLKTLGIKLSVDDFGTGYSSLGYLKRLPFDRIKIDQSFVRDLPHNEDDIAITRAIIGIANSLRKEVIAEGVEQPEQRDFLLAQGCELMQGYHFGRPIPADAFTALLERRQPLP
jgi:diguanylate cyclase (GGDEF)-like protein/PAS domain S-box-containing protein